MAYTDPSQFILTHVYLKQKAAEIPAEPFPVHNKSNLKLNTNTSLPSMYVTCKKSTANLKLLDNPIVSLDTSTVYDQLC